MDSPTTAYAWYENRSCGGATVNQDLIRSGSNQKHITPTRTSSVTVVEITFPDSPK